MVDVFKPDIKVFIKLIKINKAKVHYLKIKMAITIISNAKMVRKKIYTYRTVELFHHI